MDSTPAPRSIPYRLIVGSTLVLVLALILMNYLEKAHRVLEEQSVSQQKRVITSALVVVFSSYAVDNRLHELQQLNGANPFEFLQQFNIALSNYRGEAQLADGLATGWYYDDQAGVIFFQPIYLEDAPRLQVVFDFIDRDKNGVFDKQVDKVRSLRLQELDWL